MSYAITLKQSESPSSSLVGPSPVLTVPLGVASTLSQLAPEKSSEGPDIEVAEYAAEGKPLEDPCPSLRHE